MTTYIKKGNFMKNLFSKIIQDKVLGLWFTAFLFLLAGLGFGIALSGFIMLLAGISIIEFFKTDKRKEP